MSIYVYDYLCQVQSYLQNCESQKYVQQSFHSNPYRLHTIIPQDMTTIPTRSIRYISMLFFMVCVSYISLSSIELFPSSISTSFSSEMVYHILGIFWLDVSRFISFVHEGQLLSIFYILYTLQIPSITFENAYAVRVHTVIDIPTERCSYEFW